MNFCKMDADMDYTVLFLRKTFMICTIDQMDVKSRACADQGSHSNAPTLGLILRQTTQITVENVVTFVRVDWVPVVTCDDDQA